jgi:hypothetical protein
MAKRSNRGTSNGYRPTFQVSGYQRPWYQRLTPITWIAIGAGVFLLVIGVLLLTGNLLQLRGPSQAAIESGMVRPVSSPGVPAATAVLEQGVQGANASGTATPRPTPRASSTPRPTWTPAPTFEPQPTGTPVGSSSIDWEARMFQTASGEWMAPDDTAQRTERDVRDYFESLEKHKAPDIAYKDIVQDPQGYFSRYFEGEALRTIQGRVNPETVEVLREGSTDVRVTRFSKDGTTAVVSIAKRGWRVESYDRATLQTSRIIEVPDETLMWQVRYSVVQRRWMIMNISSLPSNGELFSPEGKAAFDAFYKKTMEEQAKNATPTPTP